MSSESGAADRACRTASRSRTQFESRVLSTFFAGGRMSLTLPMTVRLTTSAVACGEDGIDEESESANDSAVSGLVCHDHNKSTSL